MRYWMVLLGILLFVGEGKSEETVKLLDSSLGGVVIEADWSRVTVERTRLKNLTVNAPELAHPMAEGLPDLPGTVVHIAIPSGAEVVVRSFPEEVRTHSGFVETVSDTGISLGFREVPKDWHSFTNTGWLRYQRVMELWLFPAITNGAGGLRTAARVRVEVSFTGGRLGSSVPHEPSFEPAYRQLLNYDHGKPWRTKPPVTLKRAPVAPPENAAKIYVDRKGVCIVRGEDLSDAGIELDDIDLTTLKLSNRGEELPFLLIGDTDGSFDLTDSLLFFASPNHRPDAGCRLVDWWGYFTRENVYWLSWGDSPGVVYAQRDVNPSGATPVVSWHTADVHAERDIQSFLSDGGDAPWPVEWYWEKWSAGANGRSKEFDIELDSPLTQQGSLLLRTSLHGYSNISGSETQHHTRFYLNEHVVGDTTWGIWNGRAPLCYDSDEHGDELSAEWIQDGANTLRVEFLPDIDAGSLSTSFFDCWGLRYDRHLRAVQDTLEFSVPQEFGSGRWTFTVEGMESSEILLLDLAKQEILEGWVLEGGTLTFEVEVGDSTHFYLTSFSRLVSPTRVVKERPADPPLYTGEGQAEYVIIAYDPSSVGDDDPFHNVFDAALELRIARQESIEARVIDVQDIYDEFNYGLFDPVAIKEFLQFAFVTWDSLNPSVRLQHLLLFGDGSWDYLRHSGPGSKFTFVPVYKYPVSENYYAALTDGDNLPDIHLGRLPVENTFQAENAVTKILDYPEEYVGDQGWRKRVVMVAGGFTESEQSMFQSWTEGLLQDLVIPPPFIGEAVRIYRNLGGYQPGYYNQRIVDAISDGCIVVDYVGHGAALTWGIMFDAADILKVENGLKLHVGMGLTCNSGAFAEPDTSCLGEYFLRLDAPVHGAIGFLGSTARVDAGSAVVASRAFCEDLMINLERRLGPLSTAGKIAAGSVVLETFALLGDPLAFLAIPTGPDLVALEESLWVSPETVGEDQDVTINTLVRNQGRADDTNTDILFSAGPPGSEHQVAVLSDTCGMRLRSTYVADWNTGEGLGPRNVILDLDPADDMEELLENNNAAEIQVIVLLTPPLVASPFDCQVTGSTNTVLSVNNLSPGFEQRSYEFQICEVDTFFQGAPGFLVSEPIPEAEEGTTWSPPGLQHGETYFWRCKAQEGEYDGAWSRTVSFSIDTTTTGTVWEQSAGGQFAADSLIQLVVDKTLDIVHLDAQLNTNDYAHIDQGASIDLVSSCHPITDPDNLIGANLGSGAGQYGQYLFDNNDYEQEALLNLGQIRTIGVLGSEHWIGTIDRPVWSLYRISSSVDNVIFQEWGSLGPFEEVDLDSITTPMFFEMATPISVKYVLFEFGQGLPHPWPSGTLWGSRVYELYAYSVDHFENGELTSIVIGPGSLWEKLEWSSDEPEQTDIRVSVLSSSLSAGFFAPIDGLTDLAVSPVDLAQVSEPYVKLKVLFASADPVVSPDLDKLRVEFQGAVDIAFKDQLILDPPLPNPGTEAVLSGILTNKGIAAAESVIVAVMDEVEGDISSLFDTTVTWFRPGAVWNFSIPWISSKGRHTLAAVAEVTGGSLEVAPEDNSSAIEAVILPDPAFVDSLKALNPWPSEYDDLVFEAVLHNLGPAETDSLLWFLEVGGAGETSLGKIDSGTIAPLSPADSIALLSSWMGAKEPGLYDVRFFVTDAGEADQVDVTNDTTGTTVRILSAADLAVFSIDFANPFPPTGDPVDVFVGLSNFGEAQADSVDLTLHHSDPGGEEVLLARWQGLVLDGGDSMTVDAQFQTAGLPGLHRFRAFVDPESLFAEPDETNNSLTDSILVENGIDLFCVSDTLTFFPQPVLTRDTVEIAAVVRNSGEQDAGTFELDWMSSQVHFIQGIETVDALSGTSQVEVSALFVAPNEHIDALVSLVIDSADSIDETNEGNNSSIVAFSVLDEPDFLVRSDEIRFEPSAPTEEDSVLVKYLVKNLGEAASDSFCLKVFHRKGGSGEWSVLSDILFAALSGGEVVSAHTVWVAEDYRETHWFKIEANPDSLVREAQLSNNQGERTLLIAPKDNDPPLVGLRIAVEGFYDSSWVPEVLPLVVDVADSGTGVDTSWVNVVVDGESVIPVKTSWTEKPGGEWRFMGEVVLDVGSHELQFEAADSAGNHGVSDAVQVQVAARSGEISVIVMDRPGEDETVFVVRSRISESVDLGIYTVSGRAVVFFEDEISPPSDSSLRWNRRDREGDRVANGVYLFRLSTDSGEKISGKFAIIR